MKVLVLNCGSSSLKYQLIDMSNEEALCVGLVERIGIEGSVLKQEKEGVEGKLIKEQPMKNHQDAIKLVLEALIDETYGAVKSMNEIEEFKYGYGNFDGEQKIYKFDDIAATMTVIDKNNNLNFTRYVKFDYNFDNFILNFNSATEDASNCLPYYKIDGLEYCNKVNITCIPWINFSNFKDAIDFKEKSSKPKICWDKFEKNENRYFLNFSILVNHAFQDGYHIGIFVNQLQENINNFIFDKNILNGGQYAKRRKIY